MPDKTLPTLSGMDTRDETETTATLDVTSNEDGTVYLFVMLKSTFDTDGAPDAATVKAQGTAVSKGVKSSNAGVAISFDLTGLSAETEYVAFILAEDDATPTPNEVYDDTAPLALTTLDLTAPTMSAVGTTVAEETSGTPSA